MNRSNRTTMIRIVSAFAAAAVVLAGASTVLPVDDQPSNEATETSSLRRLTISEASNANANHQSESNRSWLSPYIATTSNPNHQKAMVELLVRYGTSHVGKSLNLNDVKDALAIEFLATVDGKPHAIEGTEERLFIGTIGAAYNLDGLTDAGITHIVSAARSARLNYSDRLHYKRVPISGGDDAEDATQKQYDDTLQLFVSTCNYIEKALSKDESRVLVHDWEGAGRSAALIIAYVMKDRKLNYERAFAVVKQSRSIIKPSAFFVESLKRWEEMMGLDGEERTSSNDDGDMEEEEMFSSSEDEVEVPSLAELDQMLTKNKFLVKEQ